MTMNEQTEALRIDNVYAGYKKKEILRGLTLCVEHGEVVSIIGPNGSGKSTLLKVAAGFLQPSAGKVWLHGRDITWRPAHERVHLGLNYLMQGGRVFLNLTVEENLALASELLTVDQREQALSEVHEVFPILPRLHKTRAGLLSGGEQQSLALAMIVVRKPRVLLLDEPTAGLHPMAAGEVLRKVQEFNQKWKITIVLVEQNITEAINIAQRTVILLNGVVVFTTERPTTDLTTERLEEFFWSGSDRVRGSRPMLNLPRP